MVKIESEFFKFILSVDELNIKESRLLRWWQNLLYAVMFLFHVLKNGMGVWTKRNKQAESFISQKMKGKTLGY